MKLLILESPNKRKTVARYLGDDYVVEATGGHFRDLPEHDLGVSLSTFEPHYVVDGKKRGLVKRLSGLVREASQVLLATDADREGEAISWHLAQVLGLRNPMRLKTTEITAQALQQALANLVPLDVHLADAQQARRVVDRIYGYQVSPLISAAGVGTSAGRVQTPTLHLVVQRELERERFQPQHYWTLTARYGNGMAARYAVATREGRLANARLSSEGEALAVKGRADVAVHRVTATETAPAERRPKPPFTTSTLQQAASALLGMKPERTMACAQALFEAGVISYHRTDSVALSEEAISMARDFIRSDCPAALPQEPVRYKQKRSAQGAHEAVRPTSLTPSLDSDLPAGSVELYDLVRRRFLASQARPARLERTTVVIDAGGTTWRALGEVVLDEGFLRYWAKDEDEVEKDEDGDPKAGRLPALQAGTVLALEKIDLAAKTTKPPRRFTRATLIREMERTGIGRPSTYASTVRTLFDRGYVEEQKRDVLPTTRGRLVDAVLAAAIPELVETKTTASLEAVLDSVAEGAVAWREAVRAWHGPFAKLLEAAPAAIAAAVAANGHLAAAARPTAKATGVRCPRCNAAALLHRTRKEGAGGFLSCSGWRRDGSGCTFSAGEDAAPHAAPCPTCGGVMWASTDQAGNKVIVCVREECGARLSQDSTDVPCPTGCGGRLERRRAEREGPLYLACSNRRQGGEGCAFTAPLDARPSDRACPKCGGGTWTFTGKDGRPTTRCTKASCRAYVDVPVPSSQPCFACGAAMVDRGKYLQCSTYEGSGEASGCRCRVDKAALAVAVKSGLTCPKCGKWLVRKEIPGRDPFLACVAFPRCRHAAGAPSGKRTGARRLPAARA